MEITYTQQGDYLLPNLTLPEQDKRLIGLWAKQHLRYIKHSRPILYTNLLTKCKLNEYLADVGEQAQKMYDELVKDAKTLTDYFRLEAEYYNSISIETKNIYKGLDVVEYPILSGLSKAPCIYCSLKGG